MRDVTLAPVAFFATKATCDPRAGCVALAHTLPEGASGAHAPPSIDAHTDATVWFALTVTEIGPRARVVNEALKTEGAGAGAGAGVTLAAGTHEATVFQYAGSVPALQNHQIMTPLPPASATAFSSWHTMSGRVE